MPVDDKSSACWKNRWQRCRSARQIRRTASAGDIDLIKASQAQRTTRSLGLTGHPRPHLEMASDPTAPIEQTFEILTRCDQEGFGIYLRHPAAGTAPVHATAWPRQRAARPRLTVSSLSADAARSPHWTGRGRAHPHRGCGQYACRGRMSCIGPGAYTPGRQSAPGRCGVGAVASGSGRAKRDRVPAGSPGPRPALAVSG